MTDREKGMFVNGFIMGLLLEPKDDTAFLTIQGCVIQALGARRDLLVSLAKEAQQVLTAGGYKELIIKIAHERN
jgi:hypothetical protein